LDVTIEKDKLSWLVQTASRPIPARSTISSITGCLIEALSDKIVFHGTNLDWGVKAYADARVETSGSLVVSSRILEDLVKTISSPEVKLKLAESSWALDVKAGTAEMIINAVPADDFPKWPEPPEDNEEIKMSVEFLKNIIRIGSTFAVSNPARPLWGACLIEFKNDEMTVVSTDQFALSRAKGIVKAPEGKAILSANTIQDIARLCDAGGSPVISMKMSDNHVYFSSPKVSSFSRLIEGQYYAYEQVIPKSFAIKARFSTEELRSAASRAAIVASEEDRAMRIVVDKNAGRLVIKSGSAEKGRMEEEIKADVSGESIEIWVQHKYVLQALNKINSEEACLGINGQVSAIKIEPVPNELDSEDAVQATYIIMPMSPKGAF
jgi:DNA polymerase-3 subunit beta